MPRIKRGKVVRRRHKKIKAQTKGYIKIRRSSIKKGKEAILKAGVYAYRDRRTKKRSARRLWIVRINAALKPHDLSYSRFIKGLKEKKIEIDRKILAQLAVEEPKALDKIVEEVKK